MAWIRFSGLACSLIVLLWIFNHYELDLQARVGSAGWAVLATSSLFLAGNLLLAFLRFAVMCRGMGIHVPRAVAISSFCVGQVGALFPLGVVGLAAGRSAVLVQANQPASSVAMLSLMEKVIALLSLTILVVPAIWLLFGGLRPTLNEGDGGVYAAIFFIGLGVCSACYGAAFRSSFTTHLRSLADSISRPAVLKGTALSLVAHCLMVGAFYSCLSVFENHTPFPETVAALIILVFISTLPISFAGWGIRELGAIPVLAVIGVDPSVAVLTGLLIGIQSLFFISICAVASSLIKIDATSISVSDQPSGQASDSALLALIGLSLPFLILFQLQVPLESQSINVNFADILGLLAMTLLWTDRSRFKSFAGRSSPFVAALLILSSVITMGLLIGTFHHGFLSWAWINRGFGWLILLSYVLTGPLIGGVSPSAIDRLIVCSLSAMVIVCSVALIVALFVGSDPASSWELWRLSVSGFAFNQNSFALQCVLTMCLWIGRPREFSENSNRFTSWAVNWAPVVIVPAVVNCGSRSGVLMLVLVGAVAILVNRSSWRPIIAGLLVFVLIRFIPALLAEASAYLSNGIAAPGGTAERLMASAARGVRASAPESDSERLLSIAGGLELWRAAPLFGSGIGAFVAERAASGLPVLIIHSVPVWLLAETGVFGLIATTLAFCLVLWGVVDRTSAWRQSRYTWAVFAAIGVFAVGSLVHDFFYQRYFWFALGLLVPLAISSGRAGIVLNLPTEEVEAEPRRTEVLA